ncbi:MAG: hypothetical protein KatS3mg004_1873 [Bryobacteraceae bacterium]|nr:MAG: hypothetical protein KatS3mg004_1873 [Bryobacteraceae bacterium]
MTTEIQFDAAAHSYTIDGRQVPSVTQVLEAVGLINYSHIPWGTRQMALDRGRAVHEAIALDLEGDLDDESADEAGILGYVEAARSARAALGILVPIAHEERVYHRQLDYAGTLDLRVDGLILDWKTNQAEYWVRFQLAAYAAALSSMCLRSGQTHWSAGIVRRICVELHEDGTYRLMEIPAVDWKDDFQTFVAALRVWRERTHRRDIR